MGSDDSNCIASNLKAICLKRLGYCFLWIIENTKGRQATLGRNPNFIFCARLLNFNFALAVSFLLLVMLLALYNSPSQFVPHNSLLQVLWSPPPWTPVQTNHPSSPVNILANHPSKYLLELEVSKDAGIWPQVSLEWCLVNTGTKVENMLSIRFIQSWVFV